MGRSRWVKQWVGQTVGGWQWVAVSVLKYRDGRYFSLPPLVGNRRFVLPILGELLGLDGVAAEKHGVDAIALEDSEVCILPYTDLELIARDFPPLQHQLHRVTSRELIRENGVMLLL